MTEETTVSKPMTDADLVYQRWSRNDLLAEVRQLQKERQGMVAETSWDELAAEMTEAEADNARLRADRDELESGYYVLLSKCHRLEEERNQLRVKRTAMLDALEAGQALANLDTWSWEDRQSAVGEWDQRIARVRDRQRGGRP